MSGSYITIWSMMMTSMGIYNPLNQIFTVNTYFKRVNLLCFVRAHSLTRLRNCQICYGI